MYYFSILIYQILNLENPVLACKAYVFIIQIFAVSGKVKS